MTSSSPTPPSTARNAYELSEWWKPVLGYVDIEGDPNLPGHEECMIRDPETGHRMLFIEVPEAKAGQEPDPLRPAAPRGHARRGGRAGCAPSGATEVADQRGQYGPGTGWVVFADPEGNEFCILRSQDEVCTGPPAP